MAGSRVCILRHPQMIKNISQNRPQSDGIFTNLSKHLTNTNLWNQPAFTYALKNKRNQREPTDSIIDTSSVYIETEE